MSHAETNPTRRPRCFAPHHGPGNVWGLEIRIMVRRCVLVEESVVIKIEPLLKCKSLVSEIPKKERFAQRSPIEEILSVKEIADKRKRDKAVIRAQKEFGYTLTEVGKHLGLHYSTISKIVKR